MLRIRASSRAIHGLGSAQPTPEIPPRAYSLNVAQYSPLSSLRAQRTNNRGVISDLERPIGVCPTGPCERFFAALSSRFSDE
jgi:hypothetical protein